MWSHMCFLSFNLGDLGVVVTEWREPRSSGLAARIFTH